MNTTETITDDFHRTIVALLKISMQQFEQSQDGVPAGKR